MASADLNPRQRAYLQAIYDTDQAGEAEIRSIPFRPFQKRPKASEWRWMEYREPTPIINKPASRRYAAIRKVRQVLVSFGTQLVHEISDPAVVGVFRLAIAEAVRAPEVARALDSIGRETSRNALLEFMARARASGLLSGPPVELADQFGDLLLGDLMLSLLLGVAQRPKTREVARRARDAARTFLQIHPTPDDAGS